MIRGEIRITEYSMGQITVSLIQKFLSPDKGSAVTNLSKKPTVVVLRAIGSILQVDMLCKEDFLIVG